jgi:hypothetical protein
MAEGIRLRRGAESPDNLYMSAHVKYNRNRDLPQSLTKGRYS